MGRDPTQRGDTCAEHRVSSRKGRCAAAADLASAKTELARKVVAQREVGPAARGDRGDRQPAG